MPSHRLAILLVVPFMLLACGDDDTGDQATETFEPIIEPHGSLGEEVSYRGAVDTDVTWEATVVVDRVECDIDVGDEIDFVAEEQRFCAVHLQIENEGQEPVVGSFSQFSSLATVGGDVRFPAEIVTDAYAEEQGWDRFTAIAVGSTAEGALLFRVPNDAEPAFVYVQALADDNPRIIDLQA